MKRLWISTIVLLSMLVCALYNAHYAQQLTSSLIQKLSTAQQFTQLELWDQATEQTVQAHQEWKDHHTYLHIVMPHGDTDQIDCAFLSVLQYLQLREMDQYAAANVDLIAQLQLLAEMEQPSLVNVL